MLKVSSYLHPVVPHGEGFLSRYVTSQRYRTRGQIKFYHSFCNFHWFFSSSENEQQEWNTFYIYTRYVVKTYLFTNIKILGNCFDKKIQWIFYITPKNVFSFFEFLIQKHLKRKKTNYLSLLSHGCEELKMKNIEISPE